MNILNWISLLDSLSQAELDNLSLFCQLKRLNKWEILFSEWEDGSSMYILKEWQFEISKNIKWKNTIIWTVKAEEILWEMALFLDSSKRMATATAQADSTLITILSFSIKDLTNKNPELYEKIKNIINNRIIENKIIESSIK